MLGQVMAVHLAEAEGEVEPLTLQFTRCGDGSGKVARLAFELATNDANCVRIP
ncbi:hypothetical protein D3C71_1472540 [compost metagenome]